MRNWTWADIALATLTAALLVILTIHWANVMTTPDPCAAHPGAIEHRACLYQATRQR